MSKPLSKLKQTQIALAETAKEKDKYYQIANRQYNELQALRAENDHLKKQIGTVGIIAGCLMKDAANVIEAEISYGSQKRFNKDYQTEILAGGTKEKPSIILKIIKKVIS